MTVGEAVPSAAPEGSARPARSIVVGTIGNVLECYDFAVYGYLAASIGRAFFPAESSTASLLSAFAVFAAGFLIRPLGGILIGHIGDRHGRRMALLVSVGGMAVPTVMIGLLPSYDAIGVAAPVLLVLLRMIQGISVGGEYVGSVAFLVESAPADRRGTYGAFAGAGAMLGILLGSATAALLAATVSQAVVDAWAWRLPFLGGFLIAVAGFFLRRDMVEPMPMPAEVARSPAVEALRTHPREILTLFGGTLFHAVALYVCFVYVTSWLPVADGMAPATALEINTLSMVLLLFALVGYGRLSDRLGRLPVLRGAMIAAVLLAWPLFWLMHRGDPASAFLGQLGFVCLVGTFGVVPATMIESVGGRVRLSAVGIAYNFSIGVVGGLSPMVAAWLMGVTGDPLSPAFLVAAAAAASLVATRFMPETAHHRLRR